MIQRIQTLYLLLAAIALGVMYLPLSIATAAPTVEGLFADGVFNIFDNTLFVALNAVPLLDYFAAIFLFSKRKIQMLITSVGTLFSAILSGFYGYTILTNTAQVGIGIAMPLLAILFGFLAFRNIKKDEEIVRSSDRLR